MSTQASTARPQDHERVHASVIVCTYNRADSLARTLDCLAKQDLPAAVCWEVLVVDNNSKDETRTVVEAVQCHWPLLRYEFEPRQGLSHARNHGITAALGEILLFTDDDVCPDSDWVQRILEGMGHWGCDACGGYIAPVWEVQPPSWLTERFYGFLAIRTGRTDTYQITSAADAPYGANMAFRRTLFDNNAGFDVTRGRTGNVLASGEDGELFERILKRGGSVMFFGDARVHHHVEAFRVNKSYFRRWRYQTSRNIAQSKGLPGKRCLLGIPFYVFPQLARACLNAAMARIAEPEDEAFHREIMVCHFLGLMRGLMLGRGRGAAKAPVESERAG